MLRKRKVPSLEEINRTQFRSWQELRNKAKTKLENGGSNKIARAVSTTVVVVIIILTSYITAAADDDKNVFVFFIIHIVCQNSIVFQDFKLQTTTALYQILCVTAHYKAMCRKVCRKEWLRFLC